MQFLIHYCILGLEIKFPGLEEGVIGIMTLLDKPEGMFKTNKNSYYIVVRNYKYKERVELIRPVKQCKEGA